MLKKISFLNRRRVSWTESMILDSNPCANNRTARASKVFRSPKIPNSSLPVRNPTLAAFVAKGLLPNRGLGTGILRL